MRKLTVEDKRVCAACDSDKTYITKNGHVKWRKNGEDWLCGKCYCKYVLYPNVDPIKRALRRKIDNPIFNARYSGRYLTFKGKAILLKSNPKNGICSNCGAVKGISCKRTSIHHLEYHEDDPLKNTIELCNRCHTIIHEMWKRRHQPTVEIL